MSPRKEDFSAAVALWQEWNSKINVISRKDCDNIWEHHILHSLAIAEYLERSSALPLPEGTSFLDIGTGGGFPGIPLAMCFPQVRFTLCDSIGKKIKVARSVASSLGLENVECVNARAESLKGPYDYIVSRAVTSLENFYPWIKGKYKNSILYLKGGDVEEEIALLCRKSGIPREKIRLWPINEWINDEYFKEKFVIEIGKK